MKLYKNIKRSRLPKEVLILINILNSVYISENDDNIKADGIPLFYIDVEDKTICPYYYDIHNFLKDSDDMLSSERFILYKKYTKIAIQNSNYSEHYLL